MRILRGDYFADLNKSSEISWDVGEPLQETISLDSGLRPTTVIDPAAEIAYGGVFAPCDKRLEIITDAIVPAFAKTCVQLS